MIRVRTAVLIGVLFLAMGAAVIICSQSMMCTKGPHGPLIQAAQRLTLARGLATGARMVFVLRGEPLILMDNTVITSEGALMYLGMCAPGTIASPDLVFGEGLEEYILICPGADIHVNGLSNPDQSFVVPKGKRLHMLGDRIGKIGWFCLRYSEVEGASLQQLKTLAGPFGQATTKGQKGTPASPAPSPPSSPTGQPPNKPKTGMP